MKDREAILTLRTEITGDASALSHIAERLTTSPESLRTLSPCDPIVAAVSFEIHNYYCVSENLMRRVATAFENALDPREWHRQLLSRMSLEIEAVRPALIDAALRQKLDELRKFRHFFRNAYDRRLDPLRVAEVLEDCMEVHRAWIPSIQRFQGWLGELAQRFMGA